VNTCFLIQKYFAGWFKRTAFAREEFSSYKLFLMPSLEIYEIIRFFKKRANTYDG
jgi:hypothetical protein